MRRSRVTISEVAEWPNLISAFARAASGKGGRSDVAAYRGDLESELALLQSGLLLGTIPVGVMRRFTIRDPKPRVIHAPCFRERVLHHALMAKLGPVLDRSLVDDTFACRTGKGALASVRRAQRHMRNWPWFAQIDIRGYFPAVDHGILLDLVSRKFSDHEVLRLVARIVGAHHAGQHEHERGRGLPIGALTSQIFANFYLGDADRLALERCRVPGYVRYMDDFVWWGRSREHVRETCNHMCEFLRTRLRLDVKRPVRIGRSRDGLSFCGYRILPGRLLLSRRRKNRYAVARRQVESAFARGNMDAAELQRSLDAALAITAHADAIAWRREQLRRHPVADGLTWA